MAGAEKEYGAEGTQKLLQWRRASHWTNFVSKMISMMRDQREGRLVGSSKNGSVEPPLRFYLAADSEDAYVGMTKRFPGRLVYTRRECAAKRCDFRDCRCAHSLSIWDVARAPCALRALDPAALTRTGTSALTAHAARPIVCACARLAGAWSTLWST